MLYIFLHFLLPFVVIILSLNMKRIRFWLERLAAESAEQPELVERFHSNASRFFKLTDPEKNAEMREILRWSGEKMLDDSKLIKAFILFNQRINAEANAEKPSKEAMAIFSTLSDDAKKSFAEAMGCALLVSSYRSLFMGRIYRSLLMWILDGNDKRVKEPEQIVYRYRRARHLPMNDKSPAYC